MLQLPEVTKDGFFDPRIDSTFQVFVQTVLHGEGPFVCFVFFSWAIRNHINKGLNSEFGRFERLLGLSSRE